VTEQAQGWTRVDEITAQIWALEDERTALLAGLLKYPKVQFSAAFLEQFRRSNEFLKRLDEDWRAEGKLPCPSLTPPSR
jgi:hypothetical protein